MCTYRKHARMHTYTHQSPEGQTAFVSVMQGSERQREALLEKGLWCFPLQNHQGSLEKTFQSWKGAHDTSHFRQLTYLQGDL